MIYHYLRLDEAIQLADFGGMPSMSEQFGL
jgi:hypothetical protein